MGPSTVGGSKSPLAALYLKNGNPLLHGMELTGIRAFEALIKSDGWQPQKLDPADFDNLINLGVLARVLSGVPSARKLLVEAAKQIQHNRYADPDLRAELHIAGLLEASGHRVAFVPTAKGSRTPDLHVLTDGDPIEVEVRRGQTKAGHDRFKAWLRSVGDRIETREDADIVVYLAGSATPSVEEEAISAAASVPLGESVGVANLWHVCARPPPPDPDNGIHSIEVHDRIDPIWWANPAYFSARVFIQDTRGRRVQVWGMVPVESYFNPVRDKADRPQRTGNFPYIVALDITDLMGAETRLLPELNAAAPAWDHVSAVLMAYPFFSMSSLLWRASIFRNPHALHQLHQDFLPWAGEELREITLDASSVNAMEHDF